MTFDLVNARSKKSDKVGSGYLVEESRLSWALGIGRTMEESMKIGSDPDTI